MYLANQACVYKDGEIVTGMFDEQKGSTDDALAYLWTRTL